MEENNLNKETANNIFKNAQMAMQSISNVLGECNNEAFINELKSEYESYEKFIGEYSVFLADRGYEVKEVGAMKKAMLFTAVKMNTLTDDSASHIATMMIKGTVNGITELIQLISRGKGKVDEEILAQAEKLKKLEEKHEEALKAYL